MKRRLAIGLIGMAWMGTSVWAQGPASGPAFEVASIKPFELGFGRGSGRGAPRPAVMRGDRFDLPIISLAGLLPYAFRVKDYQVSAPAWVRESRWSISAKLPSGASQEQAPEMVQALLVERFKLAVHREKRERPVYTLTVAEGGSKLQAGSPDDVPAWDGSVPGFSFRGPLQSGGPITGTISPGPNCTRRYEFVPLPMAGLADALTLFLNRPVVDQTGLEGKYRVTLDLTAEAEAGTMMNIMSANGMSPPPPGAGGGRRGPDGGAGGDAPRRPPASFLSPGCPDPISLIAEGVGTPDGAIIKAVQQLGLKLQQGKAAIDTIVVDHLEKTPTEN